MQRRVVAVAGHAGARVIHVIAAAYDEAHIRDARWELLGVVLERQPNERKPPANLGVAPVAAVRFQEGIDLGRVYQQLVRGVFSVSCDLLLAQVDRVKAGDRALAEDIDQVHPLAIGLVAGLLLCPDQDTTGAGPAEDEPRGCL
ncbi:hypothetical protein D3C78_1471570 [compost metagenome]